MKADATEMKLLLSWTKSNLLLGLFSHSSVFKHVARSWKTAGTGPEAQVSWPHFGNTNSSSILESLYKWALWTQWLWREALIGPYRQAGGALERGRIAPPACRGWLGYLAWPWIPNGDTKVCMDWMEIHSWFTSEAATNKCRRKEVTEEAAWNLLLLLTMALLTEALTHLLNIPTLPWKVVEGIFICPWGQTKPLKIFQN